MAIGVVNIDPGLDTFRLIVGATGGRQITIPDFRNDGVINDGILNERAIMSILAENGIADPVAVSQQTAVMMRALEQARTS